MGANIKWLVVGFAFILFGCNEITVIDGKVPQEILSEAQKLVGEYPGSFNWREGVLHVRMEGEKLKVGFSSKLGNDILGADCNSWIGDLKTVQVDQQGDSQKILAKFAFHRGNCWAEGDQLELQFSGHNGKVEVWAQIFDYMEWKDSCQEHDRGDGVPKPCVSKAVKHYLTGYFSTPTI